jgi:hypothetical protein
LELATLSLVNTGLQERYVTEIEVRPEGLSGWDKAGILPTVVE